MRRVPQLTACQHVDRESSGWRSTFRESEKPETGCDHAIRGPAKIKVFLSWSELLTQSCGAVEIAFDHENGDIIIEANLATEVFRAPEDIVH